MAALLRRGLFMPWELPDVMDADIAREGWDTLQSVLQMDDMLAGVSGSHARISVLEMTRYMRNTLLRDSDWAGMAHSLEVRVPLVDIDLFRALLPILARENVTLSKRDMAQAPIKPLPSDVVNHPKTGFAIPVQQWLESDARESRLRGLRGWAIWNENGYSLWRSNNEWALSSCCFLHGFRVGLRNGKSSGTNLVIDSGCIGFSAFTNEWITWSNCCCYFDGINTNFLLRYKE